MPTRDIDRTLLNRIGRRKEVISVFFDQDMLTVDVSEAVDRELARELRITEGKGQGVRWSGHGRRKCWRPI
jgi:hypothetical protein